MPDDVAHWPRSSCEPCGTPIHQLPDGRWIHDGGVGDLMNPHDAMPALCQIDCCTEPVAGSFRVTAAGVATGSMVVCEVHGRTLGRP